MYTTPRHRALVALVVCALALGACGSESASRRRDAALARGLEFYDAGNLEKARVEFRNALQAAPNDAEARWQAGRVAERLGNYREAAGFYQGAVDVDPGHAAARADLARAYLFGGAPERALEIVNAGLAQKPDHAGLLVVRGAARLALRDVAGALQDAERAVQLAPDDERAILLLAGLYDTNARSDKARELLERGVKVQPKSAGLRLALVQLYMSLELPNEAETQLTDLARLEPEVTSHRVRLAQFHASRGNDAAAEQVLRAALAKFPKDRELRAALVGFLNAKRSPDAAEKQLREFARAEPEDGPAQFALADFLSKRGAAAEAEAVLRATIARDGDAPQALEARTRLALLRARAGDHKGATALVNEVLAQNPRDNAALYLRGNLLLESRDPQAAIADLRLVLRDQPDASGALRALARAHEANHEPELALETLRRAIDVAPDDMDARLELAALSMRLGRAEQALPVLETVLKRRPNDPAVLDAQFQAAVAARNVGLATAAAAALMAVAPESPLAHLYSGMVAEAAHRNDEALRAYEKAFELRPGNPEPINAIVRVLERNGRVAEAAQRLERFAAAAPADPLPLVLKGEMLLRAKRIPEAEAAFRAGLERAPKLWLLHRGLAFAALARGDRAAAEAILAKAIPVVDQPQALRADLAQSALASGRVDEAIALYGQIVTEAPQVMAARIALADLLATHRRDTASLARAAELVAGFDAPGSGVAQLSTFGWVALKRGDAKSAVGAFERAAQLNPASMDLRYRLGLAQIEAGQADSARANLQRVVDGGPNAPQYANAKAAIARLASTLP